MDPTVFISFLMDNARKWKILSVLQKCFMTLFLLGGAVLLEIRLVYALFISLLVEVIFHKLGLTWKIVWKTLPRDARALVRLIRLKYYMWRFARRNCTIGECFSRQVRLHPDKPAFLYEQQTWTFDEVEKYANQIARFFGTDAGLSPGDTVAIFLTSRPEYVCLWLGLSRADCIASLINHNLRKEALLHSLHSCDTKAIIVGQELMNEIDEIRPSISGVRIFVVGERGKPKLSIPSHMHLLDHMVRYQPTEPYVLRNKRSTNRLFYIYTSGTTGLPKAAIITHARFFYMACGMRTMLKIYGSDILYCSLPLYHSVGGMLGVGQALIGGTTVVIRKKFSASQFWTDCIRYNCTVAQYIGEICRYIMSQPASPSDRGHHVRMMFGNGLRQQIWTEFQSRFAVKQIAEFYGATEGNASLINMFNTVGAVGFVSRLLPFAYPVRLIRVDPETNQLIRDHKGMCVSCRPGEPGELVGKIATTGIHKFDGYSNPEATKKKIAHDVFRKGDLAFLSGDILVMDDYGNLYFKDRTGDTYRWKGENVSTNEVEEIVGKVVGLEAIVSFGVDLPGCEGKAGMVCITGDKMKHDLREVNAELKENLPSYARPLFFRFVSQVEETGTFKLIKSRLKEEAFDPSRTGKDALYYLDPRSDEYKELTPECYNLITTGKLQY